MSTQPLGITNFGAFTQLTAQKIAQALAAQGIGTTGKVFYCDPVNGNDLNNGQQPVGTPGQQGTGPVQSLGAGYALLTSGENDVLVLIGNGASTGTARIHATFTWAKDAAHLVGICAPSRISQRARIAPGTSDTAFANFFVVSGNGCLFTNVSWFQGFATGVAAEICMKVSGQRNAFVNCDIEGMGDTTGAGDTGSRSLLITAGENYFSHSNIGLDTVARGVANYSVEFQTGAARNVFEDCIFPILASASTAAIFFTAGAAAIDRYTLLLRCAIINAVKSSGVTAAGVALLAASSGGMIVAQDSWWVGFTAFGADATTKGQCYASAPISTNAGGFSTVMT